MVIKINTFPKAPVFITDGARPFVIWRNKIVNPGSSSFQRDIGKRWAGKINSMVTDLSNYDGRDIRVGSLLPTVETVEVYLCEECFTCKVSESQILAHIRQSHRKASFEKCLAQKIPKSGSNQFGYLVQVKNTLPEPETLQEIEGEDHRLIDMFVNDHQVQTIYGQGYFRNYCAASSKVRSSYRVKEFQKCLANVVVRLYHTQYENSVVSLDTVGFVHRIDQDSTLVRYSKFLGLVIVSYCLMLVKNVTVGDEEDDERDIDEVFEETFGGDDITLDDPLYSDEEDDEADEDDEYEVPSYESVVEDMNGVLEIDFDDTSYDELPVAVAVGGRDVNAYATELVKLLSSDIFIDDDEVQQLVSNIIKAVFFKPRPLGLRNELYDPSTVAEDPFFKSLFVSMMLSDSSWKNSQQRCQVFSGVTQCVSIFSRDVLERYVSENKDKPDSDSFRKLFVLFFAISKPGKDKKLFGTMKPEANSAFKVLDAMKRKNIGVQLDLTTTNISRISSDEIKIGAQTFTLKDLRLAYSTLVEDAYSNIENIINLKSTNSNSAEEFVVAFMKYFGRLSPVDVQNNSLSKYSFLNKLEISSEFSIRSVNLKDAGELKTTSGCKRLLNSLSELGLIILTLVILCGGPPRVSELTALMIRNTDLSRRHLFHHANGRMKYQTLYNKNSSQLGRVVPISRFLTRRVDALLSFYIVVLRRLELSIISILKKISFSEHWECLYKTYTYYLFVSPRGIRKNATVYSFIKKLFKRCYPKHGLNVRALRQIIIAFGSTYEAISGILETERQRVERAAGHSSDTARRHYAVDFKYVSRNVLVADPFQEEGELRRAIAWEPIIDKWVKEETEKQVAMKQQIESLRRTENTSLRSVGGIIAAIYSGPQPTIGWISAALCWYLSTDNVTSKQPIGVDSSRCYLLGAIEEQQMHRDTAIVVLPDALYPEIVQFLTDRCEFGLFKRGMRVTNVVLIPESTFNIGDVRSFVVDIHECNVKIVFDHVFNMRKIYTILEELQEVSSIRYLILVSRLTATDMNYAKETTVIDNEALCRDDQELTPHSKRRHLEGPPINNPTIDPLNDSPPINTQIQYKNAMYLKFLQFSQSQVPP